MLRSSLVRVASQGARRSFCSQPHSGPQNRVISCLRKIFNLETERSEAPVFSSERSVVNDPEVGKKATENATRREMQRILKEHCKSDQA